ncbi:MAG: hypothetical protein IH991_18225, partial [Planctomycetes bacterium]|nr:hypothetical protein [Planctomycetota bacterium]
MCKHSVAWCLTLIFAWTAFLAESLAAEPNRQVITVLDAGWGGSSASLDAAERQFNSASGDSRVDYAMALVNLRHRKYE